MNIFQLIAADQSKLTTTQKTLQRALRSFIITMLLSAIVEAAVLIQRRPDLSWYSFSILLIQALLIIGGHAIEPVLESLNVSKETIKEIETDAITLANTIANNHENF